MSAADDRFLVSLTGKLARMAKAKALPRVRRSSKTLAGAMTIRRVNVEVVQVQIPHYWAVYVHDGRRAFSKSNLLVWFRNPRDDPRLRGGYPKRASDIQSLSAAEYYYWLEQNRRADPTGQRPELRPMIVTRSVRKPTAPNRFFENTDGMAGFAEAAGKEASQAFSRYVTRGLKGDLHAQEKATGRIG